jgi:antirestriction protein
MAQIYVGTYKKYNEGSLFGAWVDLEDFSEKEDFIEHIANLHKDEDDPEFMFQDWEEIPDQFISESWIDPNFWAYLDVKTASYLDDEAWEAGMYLDIPYEDIEDKFYGYFASQSDLAYDYVENTGELNENSFLANYFDYERFGRDLAMDFSEHNGYYFSDY